jgi:hypothetical protein
MVDKAETVDIKRQQRQILLVGVIVAAIPFVCQLLMLITLAAAPAGTFPAADRSFTDARFWPIQIVLLCVSVSGNAIVDCVRFLWTTGRADRAALGYLLWLFLAFFIESIMFSVTLLATGMSWYWLAVMTIIGTVNLVLAYQLSMEIAGKD